MIPAAWTLNNVLLSKVVVEICVVAAGRRHLDLGTGPPAILDSSYG